MNELKCTTLILGSGIAGLTYALKVVKWGDVIILTKKDRADSSTNYAQGGVASVMGPDDSFDLHVSDTLKAGAGLCRRDAVESVVRNGPDRVRELIDFGARFTWKDEEQLDLGREGGHTRRRIVHAKDLTGREIEQTLLNAVERDPRITMLEDHLALDLWVGPGPDDRPRCFGATWIQPESGERGVVRARQTMLATGGCGKVYLYTTNPDIATADGVAMAARAGCSIVNLEFVQFHPTCLYHPDAKSFLISEAVRGEGAVLRNLDGEEFLIDKHELGSLAPRDVVAREIDRQMKERGDKHVLLDVSAIGPERFPDRFPAISERLRTFDIVPGVDPIPVVPAAHYLCGGVAVDLDGRTEVEGLFAAGEVACTGVHGANRLASNSLLEALVISDRAARIAPPAEAENLPPLPPGPGHDAPAADQGVILDHEWDSVRRLMWDYVGLARTTALLDTAISRLSGMCAWAERLYHETSPGRDLAELRNIALVGWMLAACARHRPESRGLHFLPENPHTADEALETWATWKDSRPHVEFRPLPSPIDVS
ncbi:MAG: L-aspartate oxidase [Gemmatimonadota bacterium]|nr:MAG: L-aspartate oxidase [Gemmatimonadota bacterium]